MNSMEYAKQMIPEADREYRVMFRLADAEHMTTDEIEERGKKSERILVYLREMW